MYNEDVIDLYDRTSIGTKVIVTGKSYGATVAYAKNSGFDQNIFIGNN